MRLVVTALGRAVIAAANPLATPLVGPFAVAVSVPLGCGAAGAVANLLAD